MLIGQYRSQPCLMSLALENFCKAVQTAILYYSIYSTYINIKRKAIFVRDIVIELFESENEFTYENCIYDFVETLCLISNF